MSKRATYLLGILATIIIGCFLYHRFCCVNCDSSCCKKGTAVEASQNKSTALLPTHTFSLKGNGIDFATQNNFNFLKNDYKKLLPVHDSINLGINSLKGYFEKNNSTLKITGYARKDETNSSMFPNLGYARANDVKNYFISKGVPPSKIEINGEITDALVAQDDTLLGPVAYTLTEKNAANTAPATDWKAMKDKLNANPLTLYFNTGQTQINLSQEERQKMTDMIYYIDRVENAKLDVIGYTDNVGNRETNIHLGQERADFVKSYLVNNGVTAEKINNTSKGPDNPISNNATKEGRAKNRRTVIRIN